jgi:hypothetical protein
MTTELPFPRVPIRLGARRDWMVWDRQTKGPAKYFGNPAVGLAKEDALEMLDELTKQYIAKG